MLSSTAQRVASSAVFAVMTALGAYIVVPIGSVPFTLQTFFVYLAGIVLEPWPAAGSQMLYVLLGTVGLPVFAGGASGPQVLASPLGGFLISFPLAALLESLISRKGTTRSTILSLVVGFLTVFGLGISVFEAYTGFSGLGAALVAFSPFMLWDAVKAALAYFVGMRVSTITRGTTSARR